MHTCVVRSVPVNNSKHKALGTVRIKHNIPIQLFAFERIKFRLFKTLKAMKVIQLSLQSHAKYLTEKKRVSVFRRITEKK